MYFKVLATPAIGVDLGVSYSITTAELEYKESFTSGCITYTDEGKTEFKSVVAFKLGIDYKF